MATFKSLDQLFDHIEKQISESLNDDVTEEVIDEMKEHYEKEVYSYESNPDFYERRYSLVDDANYETYVEDLKLSVTNIAEPNDSVFGYSNSGKHYQLAEWIENGRIPNIFDNKTDYPWTKPRPVMKKVVDTLKRDGRHVNALRTGLNKRGIKSK